MKLFILVLVCPLLALAADRSRGDEMLNLSSYREGTSNVVEYVFQFPRSKCAGQPRWNPATQEPPVSLQRLAEIALSNAIPPGSPAAQQWKVENIQFRKFPATWSGSEYPPDLLDRWYCEVRLTAYGDFKSPDWWNRYKYSVLLLDGTIVTPVSRPVPSSPRMPSSRSGLWLVLGIAAIAFLYFFLRPGAKNPASPEDRAPVRVD